MNGVQLQGRNFCNWCRRDRTSAILVWDISHSMNKEKFVFSYLMFKDVHVKKGLDLFKFPRKHMYIFVIHYNVGL